MIDSYTSLLKDSVSSKKLAIFTGAVCFLLISSIVIFGINILFLALISVICAFLVEIIFSKFRKKPFDRFFIITPLLFTLLLPPTATLWMAAIGSTFGVFFGKAVFGGLGKNVFNPALLGRLFLSFAFPPLMLTNWVDPATNELITAATPLNILNRNLEFPYTHLQLLLGNVPGSAGETFRIGIILAGFLLIIFKVIDWKIPVVYVGTVFVINLAGNMLDSSRFSDPVLSILTGALLLGAFFLATDPVTSPVFSYSKIFYGIGLGIITVIIRNFGAFNEGVMFAIILMNAVSPLLDSMKINKPRQEVLNEKIS